MVLALPEVWKVRLLSLSVLRWAAESEGVSSEASDGRAGW